MSKGEILDSLGEGRYQVKLLYATEKIEAEIQSIASRLAELAVALPQAKLEVLDAIQAARDVQRDIDLLIPQYRTNREEVAPQIRGLQVTFAQLQSVVARKTYARDALILEKLQLEKRRNLLNKAPTEEVKEVWCADFTEELSGVVGIVDVNDEPGQGQIIRPGFFDDAAYVPARDGALFPNEAQSGPQIYLNYALLPGVQKWLPRYRIGVINKIKDDACTVKLDDAFSSAQKLPINQQSVLEDVPIKYMDCNGDAFEKGDRVLVSWTKTGPLVIGFEKEPAPCRLLRFAFEPSRGVLAGQNYLSVYREWFGAPFEDGSEQPINPPLGTLNGTAPVWTMTNKGADLIIAKGNPANYGNQNWIGKDGEVVSWDGPPGRMYDHYFAFRNPSSYPYNLFPNLKQRWATSPKVFHKLGVLADLSLQGAAGTYTNVVGAGVRQDETGQRWLIVVGAEKFFEIGARHRFMTARISEQFELQEPLTQVTDYVLPMGFGALTHWLFSEDGTKAVLSVRPFINDLSATPEARVIDYDINLGFSQEVVYERSEIGTQTTTRTFTSDRQKYSIDQRRLQIIDEQVSEYKSFIYCDYKKNERILVYKVVPAYVNSGNREENLFEDGLPPEPDDGSTPPVGEKTKRYDGSSASLFQAASEERIVTSKNDVLAICSAPTVRSISESFETNLAGPGGFSYSFSQSFDTYTMLPGFIDARFNFCLVEEYTENRSSFYSVSGTTLEEYPVTTTTESKRCYASWLNGGRLGEIVTAELQGSSTRTEVVRTTDILTPFPGPSFESEAVESRYVRSIYSNLINGFAYKSGKVTFASIALILQEAGELKLYQSNELTGKANPVQELLSRDPDDGYYFHRVGLY